MLLRAKNSPTMSLLEEWELREGNGATLESLIVMMEELENGSALQVLQQVKGKACMWRNPVVYLIYTLEYIY